VKQGSEKNFEGSSKSMEGYRVLRILEEMKKDDLVLQGVLHDDDASTISNARKVYSPQVKEYLDTNHYIKKQKKKLIALSKTVPDFEGGYPTRIANAIQRTIKES